MPPPACCLACLRLAAAVFCAAMSSPPSSLVGVFDSGVGGLSVLREIRHALPQQDLLYVADSAHAPYGDRSGDFIEQRAGFITDYLLQAGASVIVVACNTVTSVAVRMLRERCPLPVVAMEPAIKPAALNTRSGVIAVLATSQTLASDNVSRLCAEYGEGAGVKVMLQACPGLVECVERLELDSPATRQLLAGYIDPLLAAGADNIVLGCTHYPFLRDSIRALVGDAVQIVDPAAAVAKEVMRKLQAIDVKHGVESTPDQAGQVGQVGKVGRVGQVRFVTSDTLSHAQRVMQYLWAAPVQVEAL